MKGSLKAKLLQHFANKKNNAGFTLIELLVVIIIIGILSAIALPSFLGQANKARQSEATNAVGTVNRAQQAYYTEEGTFASSLGDLGVSFPDSDNYTYNDPTTSGTGADEVGEFNVDVKSSSNFVNNLKAYTGCQTVNSNQTTDIRVEEAAPSDSGASAPGCSNQ